MLSKEISEQFEIIGDNPAPVVEHPTFGRIVFAKLDEKSATWLVEHGFFGLARKKREKLAALPPVVPPVVPVPTVVKPI